MDRSNHQDLSTSTDRTAAQSADQEPKVGLSCTVAVLSAVWYDESPSPSFAQKMKRAKGKRSQ